ncbi:A32.5L, partial [Monkeypox virus]
LVKNYPIKDE